MVEGFLKSTRHWLWMQNNRKVFELAAEQRVVSDMGMSTKRGKH